MFQTRHFLQIFQRFGKHCIWKNFNKRCDSNTKADVMHQTPVSELRGIT